MSAEWPPPPLPQVSYLQQADLLIIHVALKNVTTTEAPLKENRGYCYTCRIFVTPMNYCKIVTCIMSNVTMHNVTPSNKNNFKAGVIHSQISIHHVIGTPGISISYTTVFNWFLQHISLLGINFFFGHFNLDHKFIHAWITQWRVLSLSKHNADISKEAKKKETYETDNSHEIESDILRGPDFVLDDVDSCCPHHYKSKITGPWSL